MQAKPALIISKPCKARLAAAGCQQDGEDNDLPLEERAFP